MILPWTGDDLDHSVPERFFKVVQAAGENIALIDQRRSYSFHEIDRISRKIASFVLQNDVPSKAPVAVLSGPSVNRAAGIMGVLMSGRSYVPLDPTYPALRNRMIINDSGAQSIIIDHFCADMASEIAGHELLLINPAHLSDENCSNLKIPLISITDPCAIIYTSGSTGRPKGVVHSHASILNEARNTSLSMNLSTTDRFIQVSPAGSIASLSQTMSAILSGAASLPFSLREQGLSALGSWIHENKATSISGTPTVFRHLCRECTQNNALHTLRIVRLGGEPVYGSDAELCRKHCGSRTTFQVAYGSTETGINTVYTLSPEAGASMRSGVLPIGIPVTDKIIRIVNETMQPVTAGQTGEILIGGRGLAQGYQNQPDLAAEKFILLNCSHSGAEMFFRSGDLARYNSAGELKYAGRFDEQIKIHGFRVECGDIEAAIMAAPAACECAVTPVKVNGKRVLAAYIVLHPGFRFDEPLMRKLLSSSLPGFMIPGIFIVIDAMPLSPNGKINKKNLPTLEIEAKKESSFDLSQQTTEQVLIALWKELLQAEPISVNDNFFHIGGSSLMMLEMAEKIRRRLHKTIAIPAFLKDPTIRTLALSFQEDQGKNDCQAVKMGAQNDNTPLIIIGQGEYIHYIAKEFSSIRPVWRFHLPNYIDLLTWKGKESDLTIENMARIYTDLILAHIQADRLYLAGHSFNGCLAMAVAQQLEAAGRDPLIVILFDTLNVQNAMKMRAWKWKLKMALKAVINKIIPSAPYAAIKFKNLQRIKFNSKKPVFIDEEHKMILSQWADSGTIVSEKEFGKVMHYIRHQMPYHHPYKQLAGKGILFRVEKKKCDIFKFILPDYGWGKHFRGGCVTVEMAGAHCSMLQPPVLSILVKKLIKLTGNSEIA